MTHDVIQQLEAYGAHADAVAPAISTDELDLRSAGRIPARAPQHRIPNWAVAVGAAVAVFILIGGVVWLVGGNGSDVVDEPMPVTTSVAVTPTTIAPSAPVFVPDAWDPILADRNANVAPPAATCPPGSDPNTPGVVDQARPNPGFAGNQPAAFDRHTGRIGIVYVDAANETWTFDVCTNTWQQMNPTGSPSGDILVYDIDSDRIVSLGSTFGSAYDPNTNTWTRISDREAMPGDHPTAPWNVYGAVYDPKSGLVLARYDQLSSILTVLIAYDVDADQWTRVGPLEYRAWRNLIGYSSQTDRLVFAGYGRLGGAGMGVGGPSDDEEEPSFFRSYDEGPPLVVDPRTGIAMATERGASIMGGYTVISYAAETDTALVQTWPDNEICWFDPGTLTWDNCLETEYPADVLDRDFSAMVGDPINNRLVLIQPQQARESTVWAVNIDTGDWTQLLARPTP